MFWALIYRVLYKIHHRLFLRPGKPLAHAKLIVVGSFLAGGAGKTPFVIWLANHIASLYKNKKVAVLCHSWAQDEFELLKREVPEASVIATSNRYRTAKALDPDFDFIVCDDGFEDSRLSGAFVIRLDWGEPPCRLRDLWPAGPNRSLVQDHAFPDMVLNCGGEESDVRFAISGIVNGLGEALEICGMEEGLGMCAVCGIGNAGRFFRDLRLFGVNAEREVVRPDHDSRFDAAVRKILKSSRGVILTEKDYVRLQRDLQNSPVVYRCLQKVEICPEKIVTLFRKEGKNDFV